MTKNGVNGQVYTRPHRDSIKLIAEEFQKKISDDSIFPAFSYIIMITDVSTNLTYTITRPSPEESQQQQQCRQQKTAFANIVYDSENKINLEKISEQNVYYCTTITDLKEMVVWIINNPDCFIND